MLRLKIQLMPVVVLLVLAAGQITTPADVWAQSSVKAKIRAPGEKDWKPINVTLERKTDNESLNGITIQMSPSSVTRGQTSESEALNVDPLKFSWDALEKLPVITNFETDWKTQTPGGGMIVGGLGIIGKIVDKDEKGENDLYYFFGGAGLVGLGVFVFIWKHDYRAIPLPNGALLRSDEILSQKTEVRTSLLPLQGGAALAVSVTF